MSRKISFRSRASRGSVIINGSILRCFLVSAILILAWNTTRLKSLSRYEKMEPTSHDDISHAFHQKVSSQTLRPFLSIPDHSSKPALKHPHWGAQTPNGTRGYVHNPYHHLANPLAFSISSHAEHEAVCPSPGQGVEGPEGAVGMQKIQIASPSAVSRGPRIFCAIYTFDQRVNNTQAIRETWGKRCDGLLFASTVTNETTLHVHIPHQSRFEGYYKGMWQKVRAIIAYLGDYFSDDFDYFHICGDDTFVLVDNLRAFLNDKNPEKPLFFGFWMHSPDWKQNHKYPEDFYYMGGGSGYTISRAALRQFVQHAIPVCQPEKEAPQEDVLVSWCFRSVLNVTGVDTRDETGAHRYHQLPVNRYMLFPEKKKFGMSTFLFRKALEFMQEYHGFPIVYGLGKWQLIELS